MIKAIKKITSKCMGWNKPSIGPSAKSATAKTLLNHNRAVKWMGGSLIAAVSVPFPAIAITSVT